MKKSRLLRKGSQMVLVTKEGPGCVVQTELFKESSPRVRYKHRHGSRSFPRVVKEFKEQGFVPEKVCTE